MRVGHEVTFTSPTQNVNCSKVLQRITSFPKLKVDNDKTVRPSISFCFIILLGFRINSKLVVITTLKIQHSVHPTQSFR